MFDNIDFKKILFFDIETVSSTRYYNELPSNLQYHWQRKCKAWSTQGDAEALGEELYEKLYSEKAGIYAGDHTGYYSLADWYPKFHLTAITHKKNPVSPATIGGIPPQEDAWLGKATERIFLAPIKMTMVPEIMDMDMPVEGVFHNLVITKINKEYAGQGQKVMNAMWGAGQIMFNKILVLADEKVRIQDYESSAKYVFQNLNPATDIYFSTGPMDVLDHSCSKLGFGGKMCIDGTAKLTEETDDNYQEVSAFYQLQDGFLESRLPEIKSVNTTLLKNQIPCLIISPR